MRDPLMGAMRTGLFRDNFRVARRKSFTSCIRSICCRVERKSSHGAIFFCLGTLLTLGIRGPCIGA